MEYDFYINLKNSFHTHCDETFTGCQLLVLYYILLYYT